MMASLHFTATHLVGLMIVERKLVSDPRGSFARMFCADEFAAAGCPFAVAQVNQSMTRTRGSVRGLHYQHGADAEDKLVTCLVGEVFDVAVDLRADSPTYLHHHGERLTADNGRALLIPKGFAHGFQALSDAAVLVYLHSRPYAPQAEAALDATDPDLAIPWPLAVAGRSPRDLAAPRVGTMAGPPT